jgi:hypothetical protein
MRGDRTEIDCVTVGPRTSSPAGADVSIRAADVFDDDMLTERCPHTLGHNPPYHVGGAARSERHDHGDGARRIGFRQCHRRDGRQRCSTRCQFQKLTAAE